MGQKINPISFRLAVNKDWRSKWYATGKEYTDNLHEDLKIRKYIKKRLHMSGISKVIIERAWNSVRVTLSTARPGLVIGRKGSEIERMTNEISQLCGGCQEQGSLTEQFSVVKQVEPPGGFVLVRAEKHCHIATV